MVTPIPFMEPSYLLVICIHHKMTTFEVTPHPLPTITGNPGSVTGKNPLPFPTIGAITSTSGQGEFLKKRSDSLLNLEIYYMKRCQRNYTRSRITRTRLYRIIAYFEGHLPHQKSLH